MFNRTQKRIICFTLIVFIIFSITFPTSADNSKTVLGTALYSKSAALIDGLNGELLYGKDEDIPLSMASTTKIMTCITALEYGDVNQYVKVSKNAASQPKVHLSMKIGEEYLLKDLLYSMMLESHNDSSVCIAEGISGSVEEFTSLMNNRAKELGLTNTYFITPNGLDAENSEGTHHTTAIELAKIMKYCVKDSPKSKEFLKITQTRTYAFSDKSKQRNFSCTNHNYMFDKMDGIISGKTGYTSKAGYCYVGALEVEGRVYIVALLACGWPNNKNYKWKDANLLLSYGRDNFYYIDINSLTLPDDILNSRRVIFNNKNIEETYVDVGLIKTYTNKEYEIVQKDDTAYILFDVEETLTAPIDSGDVIGFVNYYINDELIKSYEIITKEKVDPPGFTYFIMKSLNIFML